MKPFSRARAMSLPGGIPFRDPRTGMEFPGMQANWDGQITKIINHRRANKVIYPADEEGGKYFQVHQVDAELLESQRARLKNDKRIFTDGVEVQHDAIKVNSPAHPCPYCTSMEATPKFCPTCASKRIISWVCKQCGKERSA